MRIPTTVEKIESFMQALGSRTNGTGRVYFTGGVSALLIGWRETTIDIDVKFDPEPSGIFEQLPALKEELTINIELAAPDQFIPELPGWKDRSRYIATHGKIDFYHYDFYSQALAKLERGYSRDIADAGMMEANGLIDIERLSRLFAEIRPMLIRYPAIDVDDFADRVDQFCSASE